MQTGENGGSTSDLKGLEKPLRYLNLSTPEYRALKNLAQIAGKSLDEEIERAVELWRRKRSSGDDAQDWSQTQDKFRCYHDNITLNCHSDCSPNLIEAAIRKHIHDFDLKAQIENFGCSFSETRILSLHIDNSSIDKIKTVKRLSGKSLSHFIDDAIVEFNRIHDDSMAAGANGRYSSNYPEFLRNLKKSRYSGETLHVRLKKSGLEELLRLLKVSDNDIEVALNFAIEWKLSRTYQSSL